jgi:hypothetical protein
MNDDEMLLLQQSRENEATERDGNDVDALSVSTSSISSAANRSFSCNSTSDNAESVTAASSSPTLDVTRSKEFKHSHFHHSARESRRSQRPKRDLNQINKRMRKNTYPPLMRMIPLSPWRMKSRKITAPQMIAMTLSLR